MKKVIKKKRMKFDRVPHQRIEFGRIKERLVKWFMSRSFSERLIVSFLFVALVGNILIGIVGVFNIVKISNVASEIYKKNLVSLTPLNKIQTDAFSIQSLLKDKAINSSDNYDQELSNLQQDILNQLSAFSEYADSNAEKQDVSALAADLGTIMNGAQILNRTFGLGDVAQGEKVLNGDVANASKAFNQAINKLIAYQTNDAKAQNSANAQAFVAALIWMGAALVLSLGLSLLLGVLMSRGLSRPIRKLVAVAESISAGDLGVDIDMRSKDEFGILAQAFHKIADSLRALKGDVDTLIAGAVDGKLDVRADTAAHQGAYAEIIDGVNRSLDAIETPINMAASYIERISRGEMPDLITEEYRGDFNKIKDNLNTCIQSINALIQDANVLTRDAMQGKLSARANAERHQGDYRKIIDGVNNTLDAITRPLATSADYLEKISSGNIPDEITDEFVGDFNLIKNNLNTCIRSINALVKDANLLSAAAVEGQLSVRADAGCHQGSYRKVIEGVNAAIDAIVSPLEVAADYVDKISRGDLPDCITDEYKGGFNRIRNSLNGCIGAIRKLIGDTRMLEQAAECGNLSVRADVEKHQGDYKAIIEGFNDTLDQFVHPIQEASAVLQEVAKGNLRTKVTGDYPGDFAQIKDGLNDTVDSLSAYVGEISKTLFSMARGNLNVDIRTEFQGDFAEIKDSIQNIIVSFEETLRAIQTTSDRVASSSKEVAGASQLLSQGATEQASTMEEFTSSLGSLTEKTKANSMSAQEARQITVKVQDGASLGNEKMKSMLEAMQAIGESSNNIGKIIKTIDEIAFQTNILALNAAVEAARAGQNGKGFAVVAEEVRSLAGRSAQAVKDTTELIENSIQKSELGLKIAQDTAQALQTMLSLVDQSAMLVKSISNDSDEQANSLVEIDKGLKQVSEIVQTNSATSEETAALSEELSSQAKILKTQVSKFLLHTEA